MKNKKILLIEDEKQIRENTERILKLEDYQVITACNGLEGLIKANEQLPDLIICDIMMPELDGYQVIEKLKSNPITKTIPFIFLTAKAEKADFRLGMDYGADDYISKPFTIDELLNAINTRLEKKLNIESFHKKNIDDLKANISLSLPHEVYTPLNAIIGFSNLLLENFNEYDNERKMFMIQTINDAGYRLHDTLDNFVMYAGLNIIRNDLPKKQLLLQNFVTDTETLLQNKSYEIAKKYNRINDLKLNTYKTTVKISEEHFEKILTCLLSNAFKFSTKGSVVFITAYNSENHFFIEITDNGCGMSPEQIKYTEAYRQFNKQTIEQQGNGLGLAIVKMLCELYNGSFAIESKINSYTKAIVKIPLKENTI